MMMTARSSSIRFSSSSVAMPSRPGIMMSTIGGVERQRARQLEAFGARGGDPHVVALAREQRLEDLAHDLLVVDDEDGAVS